MTDLKAKPALRGHRWRVVSLATLVVAVAGLALGEWAGWPFLATPLERVLSQALDRHVSLSETSAHRASSTPPFKIRFLGGLRVVAAQIEVAAPAWSKAPQMLLARDVTLELRYIDLWRMYRGQRPRIHHLKADLFDGHFERLADGRATWQFGHAVGSEAIAQPLSVPMFGSVQVASGSVRYHDVPFGIDLQARMTLIDSEMPLAQASPATAISAPPLGELAPVAHVFKLSARGKYRHMPVKIDLTSAGVLAWMPGRGAAPVAVSLDGSVGEARLIFKGSAAQSAFSGHFILNGPSLAAVGDPVGVTLPTTEAFRMEGEVDKQGDTWHVTVAEAAIGESNLSGKFSYTAGRPMPLLSGHLRGRRLKLVDLGPAIGTTPVTVAPEAITGLGSQTTGSTTRSPGKVLPARPFDLAALRAMDADVAIDIVEVDLNTERLEPLRPLRAHLKLKSGVLTLTQLDAKTGQGQLMGELRLDGRGATALWNANLRWERVLLERWIRQERDQGQPPYIAGQLNGKASLQGQGLSTADILAGLKGHIRTDLRNGAMSHLVIEAAGLDLAEGLGILFKGDDRLAVQCGVADLAVDAGVFRPRAVVIDTADSALWVEGALSMVTETIDLRVVVVPKDFSPVTLRMPLRVKGSFADPEVLVDAASLARKVGAVILLSLIHPLAALIPLLDTGDSAAGGQGEAGCQALIQRMIKLGPTAGVRGK